MSTINTQCGERREVAEKLEEEQERPDSRPQVGAGGEEEMPRVLLTRRQIVAFAVFVLLGVGFLYFVLPKLTGVGKTVHHIEGGDKWWIAIGVVLEALSFAGYVVLFRSVFVREADGPGRIGWRASYEITMAGLVATRLFAAAGAGGVALTAWALRRSGMSPRLVACRMVAFMVLLYVIYAGSLLLDGVGLGIGLFPGGGSFAITIVPAIVAVILFAAAGAMALLPGDLERRLDRWASGSGRFAHWIARAVAAPALAASGVRTAITLIRSRDPGLLGAPAWWGFDIAVLWAMFHAFGSPPPFTVIWMAYFVGTLGNLLPLPGGLGGVEGAMIGAFAAFGVDFHLSLLAVLSYRGISFWLPTVPGVIAYFQLRRTVARWRGEQSALPPSPAASQALYFTK
ncbi:MAG TPA: lysylphosphatidylglycerol synthase transmembrane domain-containing protein [Solirubrobacteraceae bacterium]|nr:lysylphosphatidylglycerol synthase transmembrane domain-containing protein [Solirubrobacteraceae bacterium]